ncbi:MAG: phosphate ABC transporter permease subunit PstC [Devosia sp.]
MAGYAFLLIAIFVATSYLIGRSKGLALAAASTDRIHSRPIYHGAFVAVWVGVPTLVLVILWLLLEDNVIAGLVLETLPASALEGKTPAQAALISQQIANAAEGRTFGAPSREILIAAETLVRWTHIANWAMLVVAISVMLIALVVARSQLGPDFRARNRFERVISALMFLCAAAAIMTTLGILASLVYEAVRFFGMVPIQEFLFGLNWEPQIPLREDQVAASGAFGIAPVFIGTVLIAAIAMLVATPIGLFTAIYLVEFATPSTRSVVKPIMEILAGVPTVVYGFFAVLTVAPALREFGQILGLAVSPNSALAAGAVMGIMIIPFISSLSDDAISAIPRSLRDGSLALGATRGETMLKVLVPAALPGIMGGILLGVSRAIGETMIVVMAAGIFATLTLNPIDSVTTVTVQIVTLLIGDTAFDSPKTLAAFALGLTLFILTFGINIAAISIVKRWREQYE